MAPRRDQGNIMESMTVKDMTEALKRTRTAIIASGGTEQHGYHLPLSTDYLTAYEVAKAVSRQTGCLVPPPLCYSFSGGKLPGTTDLSQFTDTWDGVLCRQSTGYSCGVASAATLLRFHGVPVTERDLARECFTYKGGTENWYIARALRRRGMSMEFIIDRQGTAELPVPCIAGVKCGGVGHFITVLQKSPDGFLVGDPLLGLRTCAADTIRRNIVFTGFFMRVTPVAR